MLLGFLLFLFSSLSSNLFLNLFVSLFEFSFDLFWCSYLTFSQPLVIHNFIDCESSVWIQWNHSFEKISEVFWEEIDTSLFRFTMSFPENIWSLGGYTFVIRIFWSGWRKWWMLSNHDKQDHTSCKEINLISFVRLFKMDFWSHVIMGS